MFNAKELTNKLFDIAEANGFSRTPEITAYIEVTKVKHNVDPRDYLVGKGYVQRVSKNKIIRRFAKTNVLRWLNTAEEILVKDVEPGN
jgi:hypothetical protein